MPKNGDLCYLIKWDSHWYLIASLYAFTFFERAAILWQTWHSKISWALHHFPFEWPNTTG